MAYSMTGFTRVTHSSEGWQIVWELKSVNHRYLDIHFHLPEQVRFLEHALRQQLRQNLKRGKIDAHLKLERTSDHTNQYTCNEANLQKLATLIQLVQAQVKEIAPPTALSLLNFPGVLQEPTKSSDSLEQDIAHSFKQACAQLVTAREQEGNQLVQVLLENISQIQSHTTIIQEKSKNATQIIQERLQEQLNKLSVELDPQRLAQEVVLAVQKADITEEIDRLSAHQEKLKSLLNRKNCPIGREIDFLLQELNREANTLSSKVRDQDIIYLALNCKVLIEQMREQSQNIE